jgi:hypothetical protein
MPPPQRGIQLRSAIRSPYAVDRAGEMQGSNAGGATISDTRFVKVHRIGCQALYWRGNSMDFEQNLFISYARIDNEPIPPTEQG